MPVTITEVPPQVEAIRDLDRVRQAGAHGLRVGAGAVAADDLYTGPGGKPGGDCGALPVREHLDRAVGVHVDQDRAVAVAAAQREIVDAQHVQLGNRRVGLGTDQREQ